MKQKGPALHSLSARMAISDPAKAAGALQHYMKRWQLVADGKPFRTRSSWLQPVRYQGIPAMLKIPFESEERWGGLLMAWWNGDGATRVLAQDEDALLLERAMGTGSLIDMARNGGDDEASRIICAVVARLHTKRDCPPPELIPLSRWFEPLEPAALAHGGLLRNAAAIAREIIDAPQDVVALHGDIHHGNVLDAGPRGWLAIDPKRLVGERGFDYANIFCNPDWQTATSPQRMSQQVSVVAEAADLDRERLLKWIIAWAGLSAVWILDDGEKPDLDLAVVNLALAELRDG
jgi:streptomycin 6-kinase